jgi:hypothetical protein
MDPVSPAEREDGPCLKLEGWKHTHIGLSSTPKKNCSKKKKLLPKKNSHWTIIYSQKKLTLDYQSSRPKWSKALLYFVAMQSRSTPEAYSDHDV